jgi:hypothetical protein
MSIEQQQQQQQQQSILHRRVQSNLDGKASAKGEANTTMVAKHPPDNRPTATKHMPRMVSSNYPPQKPNDSCKA